ncbi:hypothetical protein NL50_16365 [Clostridium acetobutylicum]|nr:hypothetical protein NL50_16365 [Clostridium acetobutylicum]
MFKMNKFLMGIAYMMCGVGLFLALISLVSGFIVGVIVMIGVAVLFGISIRSSVKEIKSIRRKYNKVFKQVKPEEIKYTIIDFMQHSRSVSYLIEFYVNDEVHREYIDAFEFFRSNNSENYMKVIYNKSGEFKDLKLYLDKKHLKEYLSPIKERKREEKLKQKELRAVMKKNKK